MAAPVAATARGRRTREQLLSAAADLVAERGFHAVGITDIGAAAGVSGAAIYRHFASKQDILVALLDRVVEGLRDGARLAVADARTPDDALDALIAAHVDFALRDRSIIAVYDQEAHTLPDDDRRRIRRTQRAVRGHLGRGAPIPHRRAPARRRARGRPRRVRPGELGIRLPDRARRRRPARAPRHDDRRRPRSAGPGSTMVRCPRAPSS